MALRLNDLVVCGEILNTQRNSVHGWLGLRGCDRPLLLHLTGNCDPDLMGKHIRFEVRGAQDEDDPADETDQTDQLESETESPEPDQIDALGLAWQQVGPVGTMTAARKVKVTDCPPEELYMRCKLDEPPPFEWKRGLYLEWFSQNGRVVVELADPVIEVVESVDLERDPTASDSPSEPAADTDADPPATGPGITEIRLDEDGNAEIRDLSPPRPEEPKDDDQHDPYRLIPDDLQKQFDADAWQTDWEIQSDEDKPQEIREMELMDDLIENSPGEPLVSLFDTPVKLPRPDELDDQQVEEALVTLLSQLALFNVALDICPHFTPRAAYRLLLEEICPEERAYPELRKTQWVQHFSTYDYCDACQAEFEREYEESERRRKENPEEFPPSDDGTSDGEIPF